MDCLSARIALVHDRAQCSSTGTMLEHVAQPQFVTRVRRNPYAKSEPLLEPMLTPGFHLTYQDRATHVQASVPVADIIYEHLERAEEQGHGSKDWGSIALVVRGQSSS